MRFRPCIDLHQGKVKQIVGSTLSDDHSGVLRTNFETDRSPASFAALYKRDGLTGGHVIMLGPGNQQAALQAVTAYPGGLQVGGGISPRNAEAYLDAGASHVIVTSYVFTDGAILHENLQRLSKKLGADRIVIDLSCRKLKDGYYVATDRWQKITSTKVTPRLLEQLARWCDEYLVHAVDVEGKQAGIDPDLVRLLARTPIGVTYAGGVRSLDDLDRIADLGAERVDATIGSALDLFGGTLSYDDVLAWHRRHAAH